MPKEEKRNREERFICRRPGPKSLQIIRRDSSAIPNLTRISDFVFQKAKGVWLWNADNKRYLDFSSSVAVMNIGHAHPKVSKAIQQQLKNGTHCGFSDYRAELPVSFAETLLSHVPKSARYDKVFLSNSGTESIEAAFKLARWYTKKRWNIAFDPCFHGRTMGSLSLTSAGHLNTVLKDPFRPLLPVKYAPYPYAYRHPGCCATDAQMASHALADLEKAIKSCKNALAAIFMEPIAGEPGCIEPPAAWHRGVQKLCSEYNILLVADEVQMGAYRTGTFLASENYSIKPDIVCMAKGIGGGLPLGATIAGKEIFSWPNSSHANTFGGNLLACAAGRAALQVMKKERLGQNAKRIGAYMKKRLQEMQNRYEHIGDVRGRGLMIGVELVNSKKEKKPALALRDAFICKTEDKGLILLPGGLSALRICPPLIITEEQAEYGLSIFEDTMNVLSKKK